MQQNNSSKNDNVIVERNDENSDRLLLQQFAQKANHVFDEADQRIQNLINDIDKILASEGNIKTVQKSVDDNKANDSFWFERQIQVTARSNKSSPLHVEKSKKLTLGELSKKKQNLIIHLREVDKQILGLKFQTGQPLKQLRSPKNRKQNCELGQQKYFKKPQNLNPLKDPPINQNSNRTLQLMQQLNQQKIKRHQDMIQRMQQRQQEELKKIRQLEERRVKIQLKKNLPSLSPTEPVSTLINNQKRTLPTLPKKVY